MTLISIGVDRVEIGVVSSQYCNQVIVPKVRLSITPLAADPACGPMYATGERVSEAVGSAGGISTSTAVWSRSGRARAAWTARSCSP